MPCGDLAGEFCQHFLGDRGGLVALFRVFIDQGGTDVSSPILTVAGYIARPSRWKLFARDWNRVLKPTGIAVYHATDAQALQGDFRGWTSEKVADLASKLLPIIPRYAAGVSSSIDMRDFNVAIGSRPELLRVFSTPYNACFHWLVMSLTDYAHRAGTEPRFALVHETNSMKVQAIEGFDWVRANSPFGNGKTLVSLSFADKTEFVPLQAADILAFEVNKRLKNLAGRPRKAWLALKGDTHVASQYYNKSNMHKLVADLEKIASLYGKLDQLETFFNEQLRAMGNRKRK